MTRWAIDTEFNAEDNQTIDLISIALVCEDGREYYACSKEADLGKCGTWLQANVIPKLPARDSGRWAFRHQIASDIKMILGHDGTKQEIWGYFNSYDHVAFCQLMGGFLSVPSYVPQHWMDLQQRMKDLGLKKDHLPVQSPESTHNALADARWVMEALQFTDRLWNKRP